MLFNSAEFAIFLPIVLLVFFGLPHRFRWQWLLLSSCVFYMAYIPWFILVIGTTIVIDYFAGIFIAGQHGKMRKYGLIISLIANIGILFFFKYFNFFYDNLVPVLSSGGIHISKPNWNILLPIGLSFHTFQAMSYTIEVYRGHQAAERHFGIYALYVLFFPQMVAGPIERPQNMLHQFHEEKFFSETKLVIGLRLILWGLFKKLVIADRCAVIVDAVYADHTTFTGLYTVLGVICFAVQLYADFSGCMDVVCGTSHIFGIELPENFNSPYLAGSIREYWQRWHITLGSWLRDYLFYPLLKSSLFVTIGDRSRRLLGKKQGKKVPVYLGMFVL
ncbi:MAG TPA: MBOAT family O-acyltransferase, partial [Saprospiraceae bacterium]|nr:MBOAT family O-acyltransferase [Saprospiraceae bacterium]